MQWRRRGGGKRCASTRRKSCTFQNVFPGFKTNLLKILEEGRETRVDMFNIRSGKKKFLVSIFTRCSTYVTPMLLGWDFHTKSNRQLHQPGRKLCERHPGQNLFHRVDGQQFFVLKKIQLSCLLPKTPVDCRPALHSPPRKKPKQTRTFVFHGQQSLDVAAPVEDPALLELHLHVRVDEALRQEPGEGVGHLRDGRQQEVEHRHDGQEERPHLDERENETRDIWQVRQCQGCVHAFRV